MLFESKSEKLMLLHLIIRAVQNRKSGFEISSPEAYTYELKSAGITVRIEYSTRDVGVEVGGHIICIDAYKYFFLSTDLSRKFDELVMVTKMHLDEKLNSEVETIFEIDTSGDNHLIKQIEQLQLSSARTQ